MKKHFKLLVAATLLASFAFVTGCKKDDDETPALAAPTINLKTGTGYINSDTTLTFGDIVKIGIEASQSGGNIAKFTILKNDVVDTTVDINGASYSVDVNITMGKTTDVWKFKVSNTEGAEASKTVTLTYDNGLYAYTSDTLRNTNGTDKSIKCMYASKDNKIYSYNDGNASATIQGTIDFGFIYGNYKANNFTYNGKDFFQFALCAIDEYGEYALGYDFSGWAISNAVMFKFPASSATIDYANISAKEVMDLYTAGTTPSAVGAYGAGKLAGLLDPTNKPYVLFKNTQGKYGIIKVVDTNNPTSGSYNETIVFDVKISK